MSASRAAPPLSPEPRWRILLAGSLFTVAALLTYLGINANDQYSVFVNLALGKIQPVEETITDSILYSVPLLYRFLAWSDLDLERDLLAIPLHLVLSVVAGGCFVWTLLRHFRVREVSTAILIATLVNVPAGSWILQYLRSGFTEPMTFSASYFGQFLLPVWLLALLSRRWLVCALLVALWTSQSVKLAWFPYLVAVAFHALDPRARRLSLMVWLLPLASVLALASRGELTDFATRLEMTELALRIGGPEDALLEQSGFRIALFAASFPAFALALRNLPELPGPTRRLAWTVAGLAAAVSVGGAVYTGWLHRLIPIPELVMLSPVRGMLLYAALLKTIALLAVYRRWPAGSVAGVLVIVVTLPFGASFGYLLVVALALGLVAWEHVSGRGVRSGRWPSLVAASAVLCGFFGVRALEQGRFDPRLLPVSGQVVAVEHWDDDYLATLAHARTQDRAYFLLPLRLVGGEVRISRAAASLALKTPYQLELGYCYLRIGCADLVEERARITSAVAAALAADVPIPRSAADALFADRVWLIAPRGYEPGPRWSADFRSGGVTLWRPDAPGAPGPRGPTSGPAPGPASTPDPAAPARGKPS